MPPVEGTMVSVRGSTPMTELMVLMSETASAPPRLAACACCLTSVMLGVSLTITGRRVCALAQAVTISMYSGTWPTAEPMPRSLMPCGQPKFSSTPSAPVSSTCLRMVRHDSSLQGTMMETTSARSGQSRLTWRISARFTASCRSVMSSMLLKPMTRRSGVSSVLSGGAALLVPLQAAFAHRQAHVGPRAAHEGLADGLEHHVGFEGFGAIGLVGAHEAHPGDMASLTQQPLWRQAMANGNTLCLGPLLLDLRSRHRLRSAAVDHRHHLGAQQ